MYIQSFSTFLPTVRQQPVFGRSLGGSSWQSDLRNELQHEPVINEAWQAFVEQEARDVDPNIRRMTAASIGDVIRPEDVGTGPRQLISLRKLYSILQPLLSDANTSVKADATKIVRRYKDAGVWPQAGSKSIQSQGFMFRKADGRVPDGSPTLPFNSPDADLTPPRRRLRLSA